MGSKPERDPLEEVSQSSLSVTRDNEVRWTDREIRPHWIPYVLTAAAVVILTCFYPWIVIVASMSVAAFAMILPYLTTANESKSVSDSEWTELDSLDLTLSTSEKSVRIRGTGGDRYFTLLEIDKAPARLSGNLGKLIRSIDTSIGIIISVTLGPARIEEIVDNDHFPDYFETFLELKSSGEMDAYVSARGGLWKTHVSIVGILDDSSKVRSLENAVRGTIPGLKSKLVSPDDLEKKIQNGMPISNYFGFYTTGRELKDWLVQLSSELASEVGSSVPGQFISPIRSRPGDYRLGVSINPDTLLTGPSIGLSKNDLDTGLLLCGGSWVERQSIIAQLISALINDDKRVLLVTSNEESLNLTGFHQDGLGLVLGRDFVLNPLDAESVPRNEFVSSVKTALEVLTETELSSAADFELALSRAVALGNATVADITLSTVDPISDDAIRVLHQGTGAKSFYGHQTISVQRLTEQPLSVLVISTGSLQLDMFAWDLLSTKIAWSQLDNDLVVILDEPSNFIVNTTKYKKRLPWAIRVAQNLSNRVPLVISTNAPQVLPTGITDVLSSCIALRLRNKYDIAVVSDILGLTVISTGMHSKQRVSPRESSYLRVLEPGMALLARDDTEVCLPLKLDNIILPESPSSKDMEFRISRIKSTGTILDSPTSSGSLLDRVAGRDRDATLKVLRLLKKYEPLTEEAIRKFMSAGDMKDVDYEGIIARLESSSMILRGHETHSGVSYTNYRVTMKGDMALRQLSDLEGEG